MNIVTIPSGELGGLTLAPGLYQSGISSFAITSVDLTLDAQGDSNTVFIFQMPSSTFTVGSARKVILAGGAKARGRWRDHKSGQITGKREESREAIAADFRRKRIKKLRGLCM